MCRLADTETAQEYALLDASGNIVGGWVDGNNVGNTITWDEPRPERVYKVVTRTKASGDNNASLPTAGINVPRLSVGGGGLPLNEPITRAQFATIAVRFANVSQGATRFTNVPSSHWAYEYINTAANKKLFIINLKTKEKYVMVKQHNSHFNITNFGNHGSYIHNHTVPVFRAGDYMPGFSSGL